MSGRHHRCWAPRALRACIRGVVSFRAPSIAAANRIEALPIQISAVAPADITTPLFLQRRKDARLARAGLSNEAALCL